MNLSSRQIELIRATFTLLQPKAHIAALAFYQRLFTLDPALRPLFRHDIEEQAAKLMNMLAAATQSLDRPDVLLPMLVALGRRHVDYGVRREHYTTVGLALHWMLDTTLGEDLTGEARAAWTALYEVISKTMLRGAEAPTGGPTSQAPLRPLTRVS